jgi:hypothetical protein
LFTVEKRLEIFELMHVYRGLVLDIRTLFWFVAAVRDKLEILLR